MTKEIQIVPVRKLLEKWLSLANWHLGFHMLAESMDKM
jgi:hypothetical protein